MDTMKLMSFFTRLLIVALMGLGTIPPAANAIAPPDGFTRIGTPGDWGDIVGITPVGDGRFVAWEREGIVWMLGPDLAMSMEPMIDIHDEVGAWRDHGLLGLTLDPDFLVNGRLYLLYVVDRYFLLNSESPDYNPNTNQYFQATIGRLTRYQATAKSDFATIDPRSRTILIGETITTGFPILGQSHGVGSLAFGDDGTLLASMGDSASYSEVDTGGPYEGGWVEQGLVDGIITPDQNLGAFRAQYIDSLCGKILRLDPQTGDGISSNPWYDAEAPRSPRSRVFCLGLRNPFRMSIIPGTGRTDPADARPGNISYGDVGWNTWEDSGIITVRGANLGWPLFEGLDANAGYWNANTLHPTATNPLAGQNGCPEQYRFRDLILQDAQPRVFPANPCDPAWQFPTDWIGPTFKNEVGGYTGEGYLDFGFSTGELIDFDVTVDQSGIQQLGLRFANGGPDPRPVAIDIDGNFQRTLDIPPTGGWAEWRTAWFTADLSTGSHQIRVRTIIPTGPNIDRLDTPDLPTTPVTGTPVFSHQRPMLEIRHNFAETRIPTYTGGDATEAPIGSSESPITGSPFPANSVTGGVMQNHAAWPVEWRGIFFADFVYQWIRLLKFDANGVPTSVELFDQTAGPIVSLTVDPVTGDLLAIRWSSQPLRYSPPANPCPADFNGDGIVGGADLGLLLAAWGSSRGDLNGDGTTSGADIGLLLAAWGDCTG